MGLIAVAAWFRERGGNPKTKTGSSTSEAPKGRTTIAWGAAPGLRSLFLFTPWRLLRLRRSRRQGMEAIGATSTWGCAPGCPSAPLRDSMQRPGGDSTRKVTTRHRRTCHNPTTRRLARSPHRRRFPGPPRPNPQSYTPYHFLCCRGPRFVRSPEGAHSDSLGRSPRSAIPILVHPLAPAAAKPQQAPRDGSDRGYVYLGLRPRLS